jgi:hypothetical protein
MAFTLAATVAAICWACAPAGTSQAIGRQHTSSQPYRSAGTSPPAGSAAGGAFGSAASGAFASTLTLTSVPTGESREARARQIAWGMMRRFGWRPRFQFRYLNWLWDRESGWNLYATNPSSGAYGIPQALPGYKMASAGRNWQTSAWVQIRWGLGYIRARYGSPRTAWDHELAYGWY